MTTPTLRTATVDVVLGTDLVEVVQQTIDVVLTALGPPGPKGDPTDPASNLVQSVNGQQGVVVLNAQDVGALDQAAADSRYGIIHISDTKPTDPPVGMIWVPAGEQL
jgi:hypothetical protein